MIEQFGETYKEQTGVEIEKTFSKRICNILHESPDDLGDEAYKHKLEPLECWVDF